MTVDDQASQAMGVLLDDQAMGPILAGNRPSPFWWSAKKLPRTADDAADVVTVPTGCQLVTELSWIPKIVSLT